MDIFIRPGKFLSFLLLQLLFVFASHAQSPLRINYQGVLRNDNGAAIPNKNFGLKFELFQGSNTTTAIYIETQTENTNAIGLFGTQIGKSASLNGINWQGGNIYLQVSIDTNNSGNYTSLGLQQLVSVPYAVHAESVPSTYTNNVLTIGGSSYTLSQAVTPSISPSGVITVSSSGSSFTVDAPAPQYNVATGILTTGTVTTNITQTVGLSGTTLTVGPPSNSVVLPGAVNTSVTSSGGGATVSSIGTNSFDINVPQTNINGTGSATVTGTFPNYTINAPAATASTNITGLGSATVSGTFPNYSINAPAATPPTNITGLGSATVSGTFPNYSINAPAATASTNITGLGSATVSGTFPNYTINAPAATASTNITGLGSATVSGTFPNYTINAPAATASTNITGLGSATVSGTFPNYSINAPAATASTNITGLGSTTVTGTFPNYTINSSAATASTNITGLGSATVSGTFPNYTINAPAATASTNITGLGSTTVTGTFPNYTINSSAATASTNITGLGSATVSGTFPNYTINAPAATASTNITGLGSATVSGTFPNYTINAPAATASTNITGLGSTTVTGTFPNYTINSSAATPSTNITGLGSATVSGTFPNYTINAPAATASTNITGLGSTTVTGTFPNYTINAPAATASTNITGLGSATVSGTFPNYTINAPAATASTNITGLGSTTVTGTFPNYTINSSAATASTNITGLGSTTVTGTFPNYTINSSAATPSTNITGLGSATVSGTFPNYTINSSAATPSTNITGLGSATVSGTFPNYTINAPAATPSTNITGLGSTTVTGTFPNYTINAGAPPQTTVTSSGIGTVTSLGTNTFNINVPQTNLTGIGTTTITGTFPNYTINSSSSSTYSYSQITGSLTSGSTSIFVTPSLSLIGTTLTSGPPSNSVSLSSLNPWTETGTYVSLSNLGNKVGIGVSSSTSALAIGSSSIEKLGISGSNGSLTFSDDQASINFALPTTSAKPMMYLFPSGTSNPDRMIFSHSPTLPNYGLQYRDGSDILNFLANGSAVLSVDLANKKVGINNSSPSASLDVNGTFKLKDGTEGAGKVLTSDASGNASWIASGTANGWGVLGNAGTNSTTNFIGTTDNSPLNFRVNNQKAGIIDHVDFNTFFGNAAGNSISSGGVNNTGIGNKALSSNTSGTENTAIGHLALTYNSTGKQNNAFGTWALGACTTGNYNVAVGTNALKSITTGSNNVALGNEAGNNNTTGSGNIFIGKGAGYNAGGSNKLYIGSNAASPSLLYGELNNGNLAIGTDTTNAPLQFARVFKNRKIVLYETSNNDNLVYGFGVAANTLRYMVDATSSNHVFYAGVSSTGSQELMRINGNGKVGINTSAPTATLDVDGTFKLNDGTQAFGRVLSSDAAGNAKWVPSPIGTAFSSSASSNQSVLASSNPSVIFNVEEFDDGNNFSSNTYTCPTDGYYYFDAITNWATSSVSATPNIKIEILINSTVKESTYVSASNTGTYSAKISGVYKCSQNDKIIIKVFNPSTTNNETILIGGTHFSGFRIY